jgi:4-aminobutyrate aminotransferase-like enzyme
MEVRVLGGCAIMLNARQMCAVFRALFPSEFHGISEQRSLDSIDQVFKNDAEPTDIAAIIIEPVQGEGGFNVATPSFMRRLRALCDQHGIVLVADEVQSGIGRTGTFFAMQQLGVHADVTTFAKSIAGGLPISGIVGRASVMDSVQPGGLGGTYC